MAKQIIVVGAGFAGVWSALAARHLTNLKKAEDIEVTVIAPKASLVMRPRLYEANPADMHQPLESLFKDAGIKFVQGWVDTIDTEAQIVRTASSRGNEQTMKYDRLVLAAGSSVVRPKSVTGSEEHAFDIDSIEGAIKLDAHLQELESRPQSTARNTIVICGAGFTGIELTTELPKRTAQLPFKPRLVLVDNADVLGSSLGAGPRPVIEQAMRELGIETRLGSSVASIDLNGVILASGERIESNTVVWTAGMRASPLTQQIAGSKDSFGRLYVDQELRVPSLPHVFATGDNAAALTDVEGHYTAMSCQHALNLGRVSGWNAAAELLDLPLERYQQEEYITCLDLGAWGTVVTYGWDRDVKLTGVLAKRVKMHINQNLIYTPKDAKTALAAADPRAVASSSKPLKAMLEKVAKTSISAQL